jgi:hypothetical protein
LSNRFSAARFGTAVLLSAALLFSLLPAPVGHAGEPAGAVFAVFYVAPDGSDSNSGGMDDPFRTLEAARDAIRALKQQGGLPAGGVTVYLRGGTYSRSESFKLTEEDSGTADAPIVYRSYPGETARLSGGTNLDRSDFEPVTDPAVLERIVEPDARGKVVRFDLAAHGLTDYGELSRHGYWKASDISKLPPMELYIDGQGMTLARWPNEGTVQMGDIVDPGPTVNDPDLHQRGGTFKYEYDRPRFWTQADDIWLDGIFGYSWEWSYNKIASIDTANKTITLQYGEMSGIQKNWYPDFHFAENLLEELDRPGEYYIDRTNGILYLMPNASFQSGRGEVTVTTLREPMIFTRGTSNVRFEELALEYGRNSAVVIIGGSRVDVSHCDIANFAGGAVRVNSPAPFMEPISDAELTGTDHLIDSTHMRHIGGGAVTLNGGNKETLEPGRNRVQNSHIHDFAYYNKAYNPGVALSGVGNEAVGNDIHDAPHPGILIFGNDHLVEYNDIYDICKMFSDLGAIYMNAGMTPQERGTVIRRNFFHHIGENKPGVEGVYPDNLTMGLTIEENIFYKLGNSAIKSNAGSYITARNNLFIDTHIPYDNQEMFMGNQPGNKIDADYMPQWRALFERYNNFENTPYLVKYPELAHFFEENRYYPESNVFANNVVYNPSVTRSTDVNAHGARDVYSLLQYSGNWVADEDPGFEHLAAGDFRLREDAPVFQHVPGFVAIPFEQIGTQGTVGVSGSPEAIDLEDVAFAWPSVTLERGQTAAVRAEPLPWNATNSALTYESSDPSVATVDEGGIVRALKPGTTTVTATSVADPALSAECEIIVVDYRQPITGIRLDHSELTLEQGESGQLNATVEPEEASGRELVWTSSDPSVAAVDGSGLVTGLRPGMAIVSVASDDSGTVRAEAAVTVRPLPKYPVRKLDQAIKDKKNWTDSDTIVFGKKLISIAGEGVFGYEKRKYGDTLLKFRMKLEAYDGGWYGFALRSDRTGAPTWVNGNKGYLVVIKEDQIEFQTWKPGQTMVKIVPNTYFRPNGEYDVEIGVVRVDGGQRFILKSGDDVVLNVLDADPNNPIADEGYFNVYNYAKNGNRITLRPAGSK